ncbi:unnamed protein product [Closterium sp. Naga37s-1]|nr:unnamed protein product [Closterium sp. Naga37s-1]
MHSRARGDGGSGDLAQLSEESGGAADRQRDDHRLLPLRALPLRRHPLHPRRQVTEYSGVTRELLRSFSRFRGFAGQAAGGGGHRGIVQVFNATTGTVMRLLTAIQSRRTHLSGGAAQAHAFDRRVRAWRLKGGKCVCGIHSRVTRAACSMRPRMAAGQQPPSKTWSACGSAPHGGGLPKYVNSGVGGDGSAQRAGQCHCRAASQVAQPLPAVLPKVTPLLASPLPACIAPPCLHRPSLLASHLPACIAPPCLHRTSLLASHLPACIAPPCLHRPSLLASPLPACIAPPCLHRPSLLASHLPACIAPPCLHRTSLLASHLPACIAPPCLHRPSLLASPLPACIASPCLHRPSLLASPLPACIAPPCLHRPSLLASHLPACITPPCLHRTSLLASHLPACIAPPCLHRTSLLASHLPACIAPPCLHRPSLLASHLPACINPPCLHALAVPLYPFLLCAWQVPSAIASRPPASTSLHSPTQLVPNPRYSTCLIPILHMVLDLRAQHIAATTKLQQGVPQVVGAEAHALAELAELQGFVLPLLRTHHHCCMKDEVAFLSCAA